MSFVAGDVSTAEFAIMLALALIPGGRAMKSLGDAADVAATAAHSVDDVAGSAASRVTRSIDDAESIDDVMPAVRNDGGVEVQPDRTQDVEQWIDKINPKFDPTDPMSPWVNNCGSCSARVFDVLSGKPLARTDPHTLSIPEMEAFTGVPQVRMSPAEIENALVDVARDRMPSSALIARPRALGIVQCGL